MDSCTEKLGFCRLVAANVSGTKPTVAFGLGCNFTSICRDSPGSSRTPVFGLTPAPLGNENATFQSFGRFGTDGTNESLILPVLVSSRRIFPHAPGMEPSVKMPVTSTLYSSVLAAWS